MMKIIFARIYDLYVYFGEKEDAHYTALLLVSFLMFINIYSFISTLELFFFPKVEYSYYPLFIIQLLILVINYFLFIHRDKHKHIIVSQNKRNKYFTSIFTITYFLASIIIWIYLGSQLREFKT